MKWLMVLLIVVVLGGALVSVAVNLFKSWRDGWR